MKPLPTPTVLFSQEQLASRIEAMGLQIAQAYAGEELVVVGLLKNSLVFMADLMRAIPAAFRSYTLRVVQIAEAHGGGSTLQILHGAGVPVEGQNVLLVDDVVDTGVTLAYVRDQLIARRPKTLRTAVLIDRTEPRKTQLTPEWSVFRIEESQDNRFFVGYGLDHNDYYRGLPYVGVLPRDSQGPIR